MGVGRVVVRIGGNIRGKLGPHPRVRARRILVLPESVEIEAHLSLSSPQAVFPEKVTPLPLRPVVPESLPSQVEAHRRLDPRPLRKRRAIVGAGAAVAAATY